MEIEIYKAISGQTPSSSFIKKVLKQALNLLNFKKSGFLSVAVVDKRTIRKLNRKYRKINRPTDVLSFDYRLGEKSKTTGLFGEVVICWSVIKKQAQFYRIDYRKELARVLIHGLLHLLGYDHRQKKERQIMENKTEKILNKIKEIGMK